MKVLIGTAEIAGWIQHFRKGFEASGHQVTTAVSMKDAFYNYDYDYELDHQFFSKINLSSLPKLKYFQRTKRKILNTYHLRRYKKFIKNLIDEHDILFVLWHPFLQDSAEMEYARLKNKKVIRVFVGSDARYFRAFKQQYNVANWIFPSHWDHDDPEYHLNLIRTAEKYADVIYSLPDQAGLQLRPYHHIHVPVATDTFTFKIPKNKLLKVVHAPSVPFKKGTDIIEKTLERLQAEGIAFELISIRNRPNHEVLSLLTEADILVDEIVYHGPGSLSFEGMLSGCAVATRYLTDSPHFFKPPVWSIDASNIYERLKELLTNRTLIEKLATEAREYALQNNEAKLIVQRMISDLEMKRQCDYFPAFLKDVYMPANAKEIAKINKWTSFVKNCNWYKEYIEPGERDGLLF